MAPATGAVHFGPGHEQAVIFAGVDRVVERSPEAWPPSPTLILRTRSEQRVLTSRTEKLTLSFLLVERARPRSLGPMLTKNIELTRRKHFPPLCVRSLPGKPLAFHDVSLPSRHDHPTECFRELPDRDDTLTAGGCRSPRRSWSMSRLSFLDEFSTGTDAVLKRTVVGMLGEQAAKRRTIVLTTQILTEAEELRRHPDHEQRPRNRARKRALSNTFVSFAAGGLGAQEGRLRPVQDKRLGKPEPLVVRIMPAATYSPTQFPMQYHRR